MAHPAPPRVTIGAGTHLDVHAAHAGDQLGRRLATVSIPTTPAGYQSLLAWARGLGEVETFGIEGTGSSTAGKARTQAGNARKALLVTAPPALREQLRGLQTATLVPTAAAFPPGKPTTPAAAATLALRLLAMRHQALSAEITALDSDLDGSPPRPLPVWSPCLGSAQPRPGRCRPPPATTPTGCARKACFAMRCGALPVEASSGTAVRHRRNRGGDRQANAALHRIVIVRLRWHQPTKDDLARRIAEGKTTKEVIRCRKRYLAREVLAALNQMGEDNLNKAA